MAEVVREGSGASEQSLPVREQLSALLKVDNGSIEGIPDSLQTSILQSLKQAQDDKIALSTQLEKIMEENGSVSKERDAAKEEVDTIARLKKALELEINRLKSNIQDETDEKSHLQRENLQLMKAIGEKINDISSWKTKYEQSYNEIKLINNQNNENVNEIASLRNDILNLKSDNERLSNALKIIEVEKTSVDSLVKQQKESFNTYKQDTESRLVSTSSKLLSTKDELLLSNSKINKMSSQIDDLTKNLKLKDIDLKNSEELLSLQVEKYNTDLNLQKNIQRLQNEQIEALKLEIEKQRNNPEPVMDNKLQSKIEALEQKLLETETEKKRLENAFNELDKVKRESSSDDKDKILNISKLYGDISVLKNQLTQERLSKQNLERQVESFVIELENKIPTINAFKERTLFLENELNETSLILEHTSIENKFNKDKVSRLQNDINDNITQINTLTRERIDLAHQLQYLLINMSVRENSNSQRLSDKQMAFIQGLLNDTTNEKYSNSNTIDSQNVVTERLVEFKDIIELQEQNSKLLKTVRSLSDKLEKTEKQTGEEDNSETINEAKEAILTLKEINSNLESKVDLLTNELQSYKDNDSKFKTATETDEHSTEQKSEKDEISNLQKRLELVIDESSKNAKILSNKIDLLESEKIENNLNYEKECSSRKLMEQKYNVLENSLQLSKCENKQLKERNEHIFEIMRKQETNIGDIVAKYAECHADLLSNTNELENVKSERNLLKKTNEMIQEQLSSITNERNDLTILVSQLQSLQSERDQVLKETQESFRTKLQELEAERSNASNLDDIIPKPDATKLLDTVSEIEWYQSKIDSLKEKNNTLAKTVDEKLALIGTLNSKIEILEKQLKESSTRIETYKLINDSNDANKNSETLQKEIEGMRSSLTTAYAQLEEYKTLSTSTKKSLDSIKSENEKSSEENRNLIETLKQENSALKEKDSILNDQINNLNNELSHKENIFKEEKEELNEKISKLSSLEERVEQERQQYQSKINSLEDSLTQQTKFANESQQNYEEEMQKHVNVSKTINQLRDESIHFKTKLNIMEEANKKSNNIIAEKENAWKKQEFIYQDQLEFNRKRLKEITDQNNILQEQIKLFEENKFGSIDEDSLLSQNKSLISYLRRERDIIDTKLRVSEKNAKSLQDSLDDTEAELNLIKLELQRLKNETSNHDDIVKQNAEVLEQLQQLDLLRESNITLRNDLRGASEKNETIVSELESTKSKLIPLENDLATVQLTLSVREKEVASCKEECNRWKQRSQDILEKYKRIDPQEHQQLEENARNLEMQLEDYKKQNRELDEKFNIIKRQARERLDISRNTIRALNTELSDVKSSSKSLEDKLREKDMKVEELEIIINDRKEETTNVNSLKEDLANALSRSKDMETKLDETIKSSKNVADELNGEIERLTKELDLVRSSTASLDEEKKAWSVAVESMKKTFEEEKIKFIQDTRKEFEDKLAQEKESMTKQDERISEKLNLSEIDIGSLRNQWEEEHQTEIQAKIAEREDALRKELSLRKEEEIEKTVREHVEELEKEYEKKMEEKSKAVLSADETADTHEKLKAEILEEIKSKHEEELNDIKKKSFEEGKQQAMMKSTLLERKISKLEAQLKDNNKSNVETNTESNTQDTSGSGENKLLTVSTPSKIPSLVLSGSKPSFSFQVSSSGTNNPFTSPLGKNMFMSGDSSTTRPTFSLVAGNGSPSELSTAESTRESSAIDDTDDTINNASKREADDELADSNDAKRSKADEVNDESEDVTSTGGKSTDI